MTNTEKKRITSIKVVDAGSMPDVDTDFEKKKREAVVDYVIDKYGEDSVSNIITFGTFGAKTSFKKMCTIYEKNFQQSNKISKMMPEPIDGEEVSLRDIFNPESDRYHDGSEFRSSVDDDSWNQIIDGALAIESKVASTGVHACGILISGEPLQGILPTQVRQKDGLVISQFKYEDCEKIGLIKMDFLGLDTIDLIKKVLHYIDLSGKEVPDMDEIIQGDMDDEKTFKLIREGKTIGCFQIGKNPGVRDLLKKMQPDSVNDILATTALYRPGPMGMNSHTRYAERKTGLEESEPLHKEFKGTILEEILEDTFNIIVYQEQILLIANQVAGMTLQEGDNLRKAMGKKKKDVLDAMQPKFIEGGQKNGFSEEAMTALWDTIFPFAKYAFNRAHSASYAINAYQTAYLKANYPVEFMAAIIAQKIDGGKRDEAKILIKEASSMGIKLGPIDVNTSGAEVAPVTKNDSEYDIVFGFAGAKAVSFDNAEKIIKEREENGAYTSVEDFIRRCLKNNVNNKSIFEALAYSGAFDTFNNSRKTIIDNIPELLKLEKKTADKGLNLFQMLDDTDEDDASGVVLDNDDEYSFTDKLKKEADMCGMYLSSHPLQNAGIGLQASGRTKISSLLDPQASDYTKVSAYKKKSIRLIGSVTDIEAKTARSGAKRYTLTVDDGTGYVEVLVAPGLSQGFSKQTLINTASARREKEGLMNTPLDQFVSKEFIKLFNDDLIEPVDEPIMNDVYILECTALNRNDELKIVCEDIIPFNLDHYGHLPVRLRLREDWLKEQKKLQAALKALAKKHPGETEFWIASANSYSLEELTSGLELPLKYRNTKLKVNTSSAFIKDMEKIFTTDLFDLGVTTPMVDIE